MTLPTPIPQAPATLPSTTVASTETTTSSSPQAPHPSLIHRLVESVPEHAAHLFERLFAPNTVLYTPPQNDPHSAQPRGDEAPRMSHEEEVPPRTSQEKRRRRSSVSKGKMTRHVDVVEVNGCQMVEDETERLSEDYGWPLCREGEIEKWKTGKENPRKAMLRRRTWH